MKIILPINYKYILKACGLTDIEDENNTTTSEENPLNLFIYIKSIQQNSTVVMIFLGYIQAPDIEYPVSGSHLC